MQPHIQLDESLSARCAVMPGDPDRAARIAAYLDDPRELGFHREYRSFTGRWKDVEVLVISTGMGGPSTAIAVEELAHLGVRTMVRVGSCGALQTRVGLGELILAQAAVRDEGTSRAYIPPEYPAVADRDLLEACLRSARTRGAAVHVGLVRSHDSFYIDRQEEINRCWSQRGLLGSDMETAALLTVARLRGVRAASVLNNVVRWGGDTFGAITAYACGEELVAQGEKTAIMTALDACAAVAGEGETV